MLDYSKDVLKTWLNSNVLSQNIMAFPETIVEHHGTELFDLLQFLAGGKNLS
jgi:hypothetical protein